MSNPANNKRLLEWEKPSCVDLHPMPLKGTSGLTNVHNYTICLP